MTLFSPKKITLKNNSLMLLLFCLVSQLAAQQHLTRTLLFAGSYTNGKADTGLYVFEFFPATGKLQRLFASPHVVNPSFISLSHNGSVLFSCTESKLPKQGSYT